MWHNKFGAKILKPYNKEEYKNMSLKELLERKIKPEIVKLKEDLIVTLKEDLVNNPPHYNKGEIECIDAIEAMLTHEEYVGYLRGNSLKYRWRFRYKNGIQDLEKTKWYENRLMEILENETN